MSKTVTIGIPAYNEENNIKPLIESLLMQKRKGYILEKILVVSDASVDQTDLIVKNIKNKKVVLLRNSKRSGTALTQNTIIKNTKSDILILLDADVFIKTNKFISRIIAPIIADSNVGLVGAKVVPTPSNRIFSKIINYSHLLKQELYEKVGKNDSIYLCHGRARTFAKRFYKKLRFPQTISEDAYSYLLCNKLNFSFIYEPKAKVFFKSPDNLKDHLKQSVRFIVGKRTMEDLFDKEFVRQAYKIPFVDYLKTSIEGLIKNPIYTGLYTLILLISYLSKQINSINVGPIWQISKSSK